MSNPSVTVRREHLMELVNYCRPEEMAAALRDLAYRVGPTHTDHSGGEWTNSELLMLSAGMASIGREVMNACLRIGTIMRDIAEVAEEENAPMIITEEKSRLLYEEMCSLRNLATMTQEAANDPLRLLTTGAAIKAPMKD